VRLRAAVHVHSDWSYDGSWELHAIARLFDRLGYDAVLMCEHDRAWDAGTWDAYRDACARVEDGALIVPGIEYSDADNRIHVPVWGDVPFLGEGVPTAELLAGVREHGASAVFAHPARRRAAEVFDTAWARDVVGVEWWNRKTDGYAPNPTAGRELAAHGAVPFASIDFHTARQLLPLAMVLDSDRGRTADGVYGALRARRCRAEAFGVPALRFTSGRGLAALQTAERARKGAASWVRRRRSAARGPAGRPRAAR
jgi:predicted metal-dependent phosphoesterase TrpH